MSVPVRSRQRERTGTDIPAVQGLKGDVREIGKLRVATEAPGGAGGDLDDARDVDININMSSESSEVDDVARRGQ